MGIDSARQNTYTASQSLDYSNSSQYCTMGMAWVVSTEVLEYYTCQLEMTQGMQEGMGVLLHLDKVLALHTLRNSTTPAFQ